MASPEFGIYGLEAGGGTLALCPLPVGKMGAVRDWAPDLVISMCEGQEMPADLWEGYDLRHVPVVDYGVPVGVAWDAVEAEALRLLRRGGRVLVHCKGGCGRSGMAVLRLMLAAGEGEALARLRALRPCAVETAAQMDWALGKVG